MKKNILLSLLVAFALSAHAAYDLSGPKTIFELPANKGTNKFTFFNFTTGKEVSALDSASAAWDIAFSKTDIILNGGSKGPSSVGAQKLVSTSFETQTEAPASGYSVYSFGGSGSWYTYYGAGPTGPHTIVPLSDALLAIRLADGRYVKLEMLNYYLGIPLNVPTTIGLPPYTGTGQYISFRYLISETSSTDWNTLVTTVSNLRADYVNYNFFSLSTGDTLLVADSNSTKWDLAFKGTTILVNGGFSGPDRDSAKVVSADFDALTTTDATLLREDAGLGSNLAIPSGSNNGWYTYTGPPAHQILPITNKTIVVRTSNGRYAKIEIQSYYKDQNTSNATSYYTFRYYFQPDGSFDLTTPQITTGLLNSVVAKQVMVAPNPVEAGAFLQISLPPSEKFQYTLYDISGTAVITGESSDGLVMPELPSGAYFLRAVSGADTYTTKVVVK